MKMLQKKRYSVSKIVRVQNEISKINDLEFLNNQQLAGPFTSWDEIEVFMWSTNKNKENGRMYSVITYARVTSLKSKPIPNFFPLKANSKHFTTEAYVTRIQYLDGTRNVILLSIGGFNVLGKVQSNFVLTDCV